MKMGYELKNLSNGKKIYLSSYRIREILVENDDYESIMDEIG